MCVESGRGEGEEDIAKKNKRIKNNNLQAMLAVSPLPCTGDELALQAELQPNNNCFIDDFDFTIDGDLLESIDFSDIFQKFDDEECLPGLEVDLAELLADYKIDQDETTTTAAAAADCCCEEEEIKNPNPVANHEESCGDYYKADGINDVDNSENFVREDDEAAYHQAADTKSSSSSTVDAESKPKAEGSGTSKISSQGKKKAKVDWTPELHRRFVQAVEQLGVDKAVPSRILEIMGIDSLTRHNIASHLQKYRSHRKHLLAREAEAASWSQRRQIYAAAGSCGAKRVMNTWPFHPPAMAFPPPPPPPLPMQLYNRPLHVWGHPSVDPPPMVPLWPPPPHPPIVQAAANAPFWPHQYPRGQPHPLPQGPPCVAVPMTTPRFPAPMVPSVLAHPMYRPIPPPGSASKNNPSSQVSESTAPPSKDSIDAVIGDVLEKPWLPLPLGLKPPSTESVMVELQKQGVSIDRTTN